MTARDFNNVGWCDHCGDEDSFLVGQDSDGNYCDKCDPADIYQPEEAPSSLWLIPIVIVGVTIGSLLHFAMYIATEVSR